jgi:hypothetical protein
MNWDCSILSTKAEQISEALQTRPLELLRLVLRLTSTGGKTEQILG